MTKQTESLTYLDVKPHIGNYMIKSFPLAGTNWNYKWRYDNGADTVKITLTINGKTSVHQVPVLEIVSLTSVRLLVLCLRSTP